MGMTIWIHTLEGRNYSKESDDHSLLCRYLEDLDVACDALAVNKLGQFIDYTDQDYDFDDEFDEEGEDEVELDPETGLGYGIDDMTWFEATDGLKSFQTLKEHVLEHGCNGVKEAHVKGIIEEIENCIAILEGPASRNGKFHLAMVE